MQDAVAREKAPVFERRLALQQSFGAEIGVRQHPDPAGRFDIGQFRRRDFADVPVVAVGAPLVVRNHRGPQNGFSSSKSSLSDGGAAAGAGSRAGGTTARSDAGSW